MTDWEWPGPVVGVLGGGQLGRMMALAGIPLGLRFRFLESKRPCPSDAVGTVVRASYDDEGALQTFAEGVALVTYEFENVPVAAVDTLAGSVIVRPGSEALEMAQDRLREKEGFKRLGIATDDWRAAETREEVEAALEELGLPAVLKTRRLGYDGKGQAVVRSMEDLDEAWDAVGGVPLLVEAFVDFDRELSLVAVRSRDGAFEAYPLVENLHEDGILVSTEAPASGVPKALQSKAEAAMLRLMEDLQYVGVMAVEFFQVGDDLLANEMAPRVHNSGHWTQNGAVTSQFENHLRAILGLPLGPTDARGVTVMINLLGALPKIEAVAAEPRAHLHLYDKKPKPGRKIGHVNVVAHDAETAWTIAEKIRDTLPAHAGPA
ncbi:MAG TPA: 5-(carboxyamino)imidazole ribonucleotide synthase [Longimicrobiales bacterium]|nr:5-(carboxyamino)imidazole ribonucleotide synthase [Longimicrobiales bacterium]